MEPLAPYVSRRATEYVGFGLRMLWQQFTDSIRESWTEAGNATYGERCHHPEHARKIDWFDRKVRCTRCGRTTRQEAIEYYGDLAQWFTDEELRGSMERYEEHRIVNGRLMRLDRYRPITSQRGTDA